MTISQYLMKHGWNIDCKIKACYRVMTVHINFLTSKKEEDQTSFDINAYDKKELCSLFKGFCRENHLPQNTVTCITIVDVASEFSGLNSNL